MTKKLIEKDKTEGYEIEEETEKAVRTSSGDWLPKSQVKIRNGKVVKISEWFLNRTDVPQVGSREYERWKHQRLKYKLEKKKQTALFDFEK